MPRILKVVGGCAVVLVLVCVIATAVLLLTSCSFNKYIVAAGLPNPDVAFQTGTVAGYNVYIWKCYQGKRILMYNATSEMLSGAFKREEVPCGQISEMEKTLTRDKNNDLDPRYFW